MPHPARDRRSRDGNDPCLIHAEHSPNCCDPWLSAPALVPGQGPGIRAAAGGRHPATRIRPARSGWRCTSWPCDTANGPYRRGPGAAELPQRAAGRRGRCAGGTRAAGARRRLRLRGRRRRRRGLGRERGWRRGRRTGSAGSTTASHDPVFVAAWLELMRRQAVTGDGHTPRACLRGVRDAAGRSPPAGGLGAFRRAVQHLRDG